MNEEKTETHTWAIGEVVTVGEAREAWVVCGTLGDQVLVQRNMAAAPASLKPYVFSPEEREILNQYQAALRARGRG